MALFMHSDNASLYGYASACLMQVDHMTKLMLEGGRDESEDKENRKGNRRETWAPGLAGAHSAHLVCLLPTPHTHLHILLNNLASVLIIT